MKIFLTVIILSIMAPASCIGIMMKQDQQLCMKLYASPTNFYYDFSGPGNATIYAHDGKIIKAFNTTDGEYRINQTDLPFKICLNSNSDDNYVITDSWSPDQHHVKGLAVVSELDYLVNQLSRLNENLEKIARIEKYQEQMGQAQSNIVLRNERTINNYGVIKIVLIFALVFAQLFFLKNVLLKDGNKFTI